MTLQELAALGDSQNWRVVGDRIQGVYRGFPFTLSLLTGKKFSSVSLSFTLDKAAAAKTRKEIKNALPKNGAVTVDANTGLLTISCPEADGQNTYTLATQLLDVSVRAFDSAKKPLLPPQNCPVCRKDGCDSVAMIGVQFRPVHRDCLVKQSQQTVSKAKQNQESGNYVTGCIGALLGAFIGCIPTILVIFLLNYELGVLYFLIPMASYWGYKLLKGKVGPVARIAVIICSVLAFVMMQPVIYHIFCVIEGYTEGLLFNITYYFKHIFSLETFLISGWFGLLFLIIGLVSSFRMLGSTNDDAIQGAMANLESVTNRDGSHTPVMGYEMQRADREQ